MEKPVETRYVVKMFKNGRDTDRTKYFDNLDDAEKYFSSSKESDIYDLQLIKEIIINEYLAKNHI